MNSKCLNNPDKAGVFVHHILKAGPEFRFAASDLYLFQIKLVMAKFWRNYFLKYLLSLLQLNQTLPNLPAPYDFIFNIGGIPPADGAGHRLGVL